MEDDINTQSTSTSTGTNWLDLLKTGVQVGAAAVIANNTNKPAAAGSPSKPVNMKLILGIAAGVLVLIIALFAFKK